VLSATLAANVVKFVKQAGRHARDYTFPVVCGGAGVGKTRLAARSLVCCREALQDQLQPRLEQVFLEVPQPRDCALTDRQVEAFLARAVLSHFCDATPTPRELPHLELGWVLEYVGGEERTVVFCQLDEFQRDPMFTNAALRVAKAYLPLKGTEACLFVPVLSGTSDSQLSLSHKEPTDYKSVPIVVTPFAEEVARHIVVSHLNLPSASSLAPFLGLIAHLGGTGSFLSELVHFVEADHALAAALRERQIVGKERLRQLSSSVLDWIDDRYGLDVWLEVLERRVPLVEAPQGVQAERQGVPQEEKQGDGHVAFVASIIAAVLSGTMVSVCCCCLGL
jgi:hypothetical protein